MYSKLVFLTCFLIFTIVKAADPPKALTDTDCNAFKNATDCCGAKCMYYSCNATKDADPTVFACHAKGWNDTAVCKENTTTDTCPPPSPITTTTAATVDVCESLNNQTTCCADPGKSCMFVNCTNAEDSLVYTGCRNNATDMTTICVKDTIKDLCTLSPTTPPPDVCASLKIQASCCAEKACVFINCTDKDNTQIHQGCHTNTSDLTTICADKEQNLCAQTTAAPPVVISTAPTDTCGTLASETTCCAEKTCMFVNCTDKANSSNVHTGCHVNTSDMTAFCTNTAQNLCNGTLTTPAPDASPNAASKDGGQHFDGASFIGGIVLCLGIVAIMFFGHKFYVAKTERNYHTL